MRIPDAATFDLYFSRRSLTEKWVTDILPALWDHSIQFTGDLYSEVTQWDEVLTAPFPRGWSIGPRTSSPSLQEMIHSEVEQGYASFGLGATVEVTLDPDLVSICYATPQFVNQEQL